MALCAGKLGLWVPPYPTRAGSVYTLQRMFDAHDPGPQKTLSDGTQVGEHVHAPVVIHLGGRPSCASSTATCTSYALDGSVCTVLASGSVASLRCSTGRPHHHEGMCMWGARHGTAGVHVLCHCVLRPPAHCAMHYASLMRGVAWLQVHMGVRALRLRPMPQGAGGDGGGMGPRRMQLLSGGADG